MLRVMAALCVLAGVAHADEVTVGQLVGGLSLAQSADGKSVTLRHDTFKNGCSRTEIVVAPVGKVEGERVTIATRGNCPDLELVVDRAGEALAKRLTPRGFAELGAFGGYPDNYPGEFVLRFTEQTTTLTATLTLKDEVVGKAEFPRGKGTIYAWTALLEAPRQLLYIHVETDLSDASKRTEKTSTWRVIQPSKPAPRQMRTLAKRGSEDPDDVAKALARSKLTRKCGHSAVDWSGDYALVTCDDQMILLDKQGKVLCDEATPGSRLHTLHVFEASFGALACAEVDGDANDRLVCFDGAGKRVFDHRSRSTAYAFFDGPAYIRVSEYGTGPPKISRPSWTAGTFK